MKPRALLLIALVLGARALGAQAVPVHPAGDLSALVGMAFDVPIVADWSGRGDKLGSFALTLRWDPAVLRYDGGTSGSFGQLTANQDSAPQGVVRLSGANPAGATGVVTLGVGRFTPLSTASTVVQLDLTELYASAPTFADVLSSATPTNGLYCHADGYWGDPDTDGGSDSRDALIALTEAVGLDVSSFPEHGLSDVDGSGVVTARDALVILSYAVGLDVSAFRIMRLAVGSCGSTVATTYAVSPGGDTVVAGQSMEFLFSASSGGASRVLPDVVWRTGDATVLAVQPDGHAFAAGVGTVTVVGKSGLRDSATAQVTVVARRRRHYVQASAASATNHLGTSALPFAGLDEAAAVARAGDTVYVRPGRYGDPAYFSSSVTILGLATPGNDVVLDQSGGYGVAALTFNGGGRFDVRNVTIDGALTGINVGTADTVVVDSLRYHIVAGACADAAISTGFDLAALYVRRSTLAGDGASGCATGIALNGKVALLVVDSTDIGDFYGEGIYANSADSAFVRGSRIHDNGYSGIDISSCSYSCVGADTAVAVVVTGTRLARNGSEPVAVSGARSLVVDHSVLDAGQSNPVYVSGTSGGSGWVRLVADSLRLTDNYDWIDAYSLDSATVDSTRISGDIYQGSFSGVRHLRVTTSTITGIHNGYGISSYAPTGGGSVTVDSVSITGLTSCNRCADGISTAGAAVSVNRLAAQNFYYAVDANDSTVSVTNSAISHAYYGVYAYSSGIQSAVVRKVSVSDATYGVYTTNKITVADTLTLSNVNYGFYADQGGVDTLRNSTFTGITATGISLSAGTLADSGLLSANTIGCTPSASASGIEATGSGHRLAANTVTGCTYPIFAYSGDAGLTVTVTGNSISFPPGAYGPGIQIPPSGRVVVTGNTITGGATQGGISIYGYSYAPVAYARVDSNTIDAGTERGIVFNYVDSLQAVGNLIQDLGTTSYYYGPIGIAVQDGAQYWAVLRRNTLRRVHGRGINISITAPTTVAIDSNAISNTDTAAVWVDYGVVSMTGNNIRNNHLYGLRIPNVNGLSYQVHGGAFVGDSLYAIASGNLVAGGDPVNATSNWWGTPAGANTPGADSTFGPVNVSAPLASDPLGLPPLAPPVFRPMLAASSLAAPVALALAPAAALPSPSVRSAYQPRVARAVPSVKGTGTTKWAQAAVTRHDVLTQRAAARAARELARAQAAAARLAAEQARPAPTRVRRAP